MESVNLVTWNNSLINFIKNEIYVKPQYSFLLPFWEEKVKRENELIKKFGYDLNHHHCSRNVIDRVGEEKFTLNTKNIIGWVPFQEYPQISFKDAMIESAQNIASKGKTIDFLWSGGLDSVAGLLAFIEAGLDKQLHIINGGAPESPEIFNKLIKDRIDYTLLPANDKDKLTSTARPDVRVLTTMSEMDPMFGNKSTMAGQGVVVDNWPDMWKIKRQHFLSHQSWRWCSNFQGDKVDIDNYMPFALQEPLEKWLCNHVINEEMVYYDVSDKNWEFGNINCPLEKHYKKCKKPMRDFIDEILKGKIPYLQEKIPSGSLIKKLNKSTLDRVIGVTDKGDVITPKSFYNYNFLKFINVDLLKEAYSGR